MAVKPITNNQTVNKETIDRSKQVSMKNQGNSRTAVVPGKDFTRGFSITLKDIDSAVLSHIKNIINPKIKEANEIIPVPVLWANEERWKNYRKRGVLRDKNGSLILPLIMIKRNDVAFNEIMPLSFDHDVRGEFIKFVRQSKWSKANRYDRFAAQFGKNPVTETITTGMPDFVICSYNIILLTNFMDQMNVLSELFLEHLETYWGDSTSYKFLSGLDGSISDASEMTVDSERLIKNEFGVSIKGYVIPEFTSNVFGATAEVQKSRTPSKVVFGFEGDATDTQVEKL